VTYTPYGLFRPLQEMLQAAENMAKAEERKRKKEEALRLQQERLAQQQRKELQAQVPCMLCAVCVSSEHTRAVCVYALCCRFRVCSVLCASPLQVCAASIGMRGNARSRTHVGWAHNRSCSYTQSEVVQTWVLVHPV
jgi:hypothetical protein